MIQTIHVKGIRFFRRLTCGKPASPVRIYFVTGEGRRAAEIAPAMEKMRQKDYEARERCCFGLVGQGTSDRGGEPVSALAVLAGCNT